MSGNWNYQPLGGPQDRKDAEIAALRHQVQRQQQEIDSLKARNQALLTERDFLRQTKDQLCNLYQGQINELTVKDISNNQQIRKLSDQLVGVSKELQMATEERDALRAPQASGNLQEQVLPSKGLALQPPPAAPAPAGGAASPGKQSLSSAKTMMFEIAVNVKGIQIDMSEVAGDDSLVIYQTPQQNPKNQPVKVSCASATGEVIVEVPMRLLPQLVQKVDAAQHKLLYRDTATKKIQSVPVKAVIVDQDRKFAEVRLQWDHHAENRVIFDVISTAVGFTRIAHVAKSLAETVHSKFPELVSPPRLGMSVFPLEEKSNKVMCIRFELLVQAQVTFLDASARFPVSFRPFVSAFGVRDRDYSIKGDKVHVKVNGGREAVGYLVQQSGEPDPRIAFEGAATQATLDLILSLLEVMEKVRKQKMSVVVKTEADSDDDAPSANKRAKTGGAAL